MEIRNEKYDPETQYPKHKMLYKNGGIHMSYEKNPIGMKVISNIFGQVSGKLLTGQIKNINQLSKPIEICHTQTMNQVIADDNSQTHFLDLAERCSTDPVQRLKYVACFIISSIHCSPKKIFTKVPVDPQLGETTQLVKENGTKYLAETLQTNPPAVLVNIIGKNDSWKLEYVHIVRAQVVLPKMNDVVATAILPKKITFSDGNVISSENMVIHLGGIIMGERYMRVQNSLRFIDITNGFQAICEFQYSREGQLKQLSKSFSSLFTSKKDTQKPQLEDVKVKIFKYSDLNANLCSYKTKQADIQQDLEDLKRVLVSEGSGNYMSHLQFDNQIYWKIDDNYQDWTPESNNLLESDSSRREDIQQLIRKNPDTANESKKKYEKQDKLDRENRVKTHGKQSLSLANLN